MRTSGSKRKLLAVLVFAAASVLWLALKPPSENSEPPPIRAAITAGSSAASMRPARLSVLQPPRVRSIEATYPEKEQLRLLGSSACLETCGSPCASISDTGEPVCPPECVSDEECEPDERCRPTNATDLDTHRTPRCQRSHCYADDDCGPHGTCVAFASRRATINVCQPSGERAAGEPCLEGFKEKGQCQRGLACLSGICYEQATCETTDDCPIGTTCLDTANGPQCRPFCESNTDCQSGTECLELEGTYGKKCLNREAFGCIFDKCDAPFECVSYFQTSVGVRPSACHRPCREQSDCSDSQVCGTIGFREETYCFERCNPDSCEEDWLCAQNAIHVEGEEVEACYLDTNRITERFLGTSPP